MPAKYAYTHAVIMGDLVSSEKADRIARLHTAFNQEIEAVGQRHRKKLTSPLTITLGDEFQGVADNLAAGLSVVRELSWSLRERNVACRFVLGIVRLETPVNTRKAWNMMGPGLARARERLADKKDSSAYRFSLPRDALIETLLDALGASLTEIESSWTERQFEIVRETDTNTSSDASLVDKLDISRNTLYKVRRAARHELYQRHWKAVQTAIDDLDKRYGLT